MDLFSFQASKQVSLLINLYFFDVSFENLVMHQGNTMHNFLSCTAGIFPLLFPLLTCK